jgi:NTP pyrophosphatase (non-canonical NTP hydrolase)
MSDGKDRLFGLVGFPAAPATTVDDLPRSSLSFSDYQRQAITTAVYPGQHAFQGLVYAVLGLSGESGETAEQVKKTWRDDGMPDFGQAMYAMLDNIREKLRKGDQGYDSIIDDAREEAAAIFLPEITEERRQKILKELGDVFWYAAQLCTELNVNMGEVAQANLDKLAERQRANKLHGEGSDR